MSEDWQMEDYKIDGYSEKDIRICLEKNEDTYIKRFENLPQRKFNFCAAFFGIKWFAYRLMIREGFLLWFINLVISLIVYTLVLAVGYRNQLDFQIIKGELTAGRILITLIFFFVQGIIADQLYWNHLKTEMEVQGRHNNMEPATEEEIEKLRGETGVSIRSVVFFSILWGGRSYFS